ncbi:hypothetical protein HN011_005282, partial [Eciton burchellii]
IRDWLTVEEEMLRQQSVVVGDVDEIMHLLDKQKNVLRELEQKKPQLDELVHTAENLRADTNRQQLHGKVTKLREHWDETNSKVMQRKTQLDMMLGDSKEYEAKRNAVEVWLSRMETRLERMRAVGHTADVLAMQLEEQKSFHVDLHKYKLQIELFNQLTQKLIAVYQQDDTTRVKKMTENINQRYNNLNTSIINRGKLLNSAMSSLHNFDRSLDKFLAWLSEAESSMEELEAEADRLGGRRDQGALRRPQHQLKSVARDNRDPEEFLIGKRSNAEKPLRHEDYRIGKARVSEGGYLFSPLLLTFEPRYDDVCRVDFRSFSVGFTAQSVLRPRLIAVKACRSCQPVSASIDVSIKRKKLDIEHRHNALMGRQ